MYSSSHVAFREERIKRREIERERGKAKWHSVRKFWKRALRGLRPSCEDYATGCVVPKELPPRLKLLPLDWKYETAAHITRRSRITTNTEPPRVQITCNQ
jgi:hypothetical protein